MRLSVWHWKLQRQRVTFVELNSIDRDQLHALGFERDVNLDGLVYIVPEGWYTVDLGYATSVRDEKHRQRVLVYSYDRPKFAHCFKFEYSFDGVCYVDVHHWKGSVLFSVKRRFATAEHAEFSLIERFLRECPQLFEPDFGFNLSVQELWTLFVKSDAASI